MLLRDLHIQAYRGISDLVIPELGRFNVLVGANNSGKTSVLEAAALLARPFDLAQWSRVLQHRDIGLMSTPPESLWELFPNAAPLSFDDGPPSCESIQFHGSLSSGVRELQGKANARETGHRLPNGTMNLEIKARLQVRHQVFAQTVSDEYYLWVEQPHWGASGPVVRELQTDRAVLMSPWARNSSAWLVDLLSTAIAQGRKADAVAMLRLFDEQIEGIEIIKRFEEGRILVQHKTRGMPGLSTFGQGMQAALALAIAVSKARGGLLLLDEIEVGIHTSLLVDVLEKLMVFAAASDVQVICTTHSLETVDALVEAAERQSRLDDLVGYWLRRTATEHTARRYPGAKLRSLREGGVDIR